MNTLLTRYSTTLLPLLVAVAGVFTTAADSGAASLFTWATLVQAALLVLSTGTDYWLPLVDSRWRGAAKTGASLGFVLLSAAVTAWSATDGHVSKANLLLLGTAILKAAITEVATWIRTDAARLIDARDTPAEEVPSITTLEDLPEPDELAEHAAVGDEVGVDEVEQPAGLDDEPKHLASS